MFSMFWHLSPPLPTTTTTVTSCVTPHIKHTHYTTLVQLINDFEKSKLSVADFARKRVAPLSTVKKILKDKDAIKADFEAGRPTVNEIISALRIVRKFSQKNNLIKEIESLRSIEKNVKQSSLPTRGKSQLHLFCYRLLYINKLLHCYTRLHYY